MSATTSLLPPGLFITATDTSVGKTYVAALIARQLRGTGMRVGAYKPCASGSVAGPAGRPLWGDVEELFRATGERFERRRICPQCFAAPVAPPVAARLEGRQVSHDLLESGLAFWRGHVDFLLIEGVGGLLAPLTEESSVADFARRVGYPLVIVARVGLGTINHTLLTVEAALARGLRVAGVVLNQAEPNESGPAAETNPAELARRCPAPVLGVLPHSGVGCAAEQSKRVRESESPGAGVVSPPDSHTLTHSHSRPVAGLRRGNETITIDWCGLARGAV
jgi:dethiobiotin synthetase